MKIWRRILASAPRTYYGGAQSPTSPDLGWIKPATAKGCRAALCLVTGPVLRLSLVA